MYTYYIHTCFKEQLKYEEDNSRRGGGGAKFGRVSLSTRQHCVHRGGTAWQQCRPIRALPTTVRCTAAAAALPQLAAAVVVGLLFRDGECAFILLNVLVRLLLLLHKN